MNRLIAGSALALVLGTTVAIATFASPAIADPSPPTSTTPTVRSGDWNDAPSYGAQSEDADESISGELVLDVKDSMSADDIAQLGRDYGITIKDNSPESHDDGNIEIANVPVADEANLIERLSHDSRVESVEEDFMFHETWVPNDPQYKDQWHLTRVGAEKAWDYSCGQGVTVAVVDTGIACYDGGGFMKGTDLNGTRCVAGYNFVGKNDVAADDQGHGTHVAGTIAQTTNNGHGVAGLAYCANLMPVKVLSKTGSGSMAGVAEGIRYAADHGAQVINLSLGASRGAKIVKDAVDHALAKGVVVVAAAGNSGRSVGYPAAYPGVIAVSATDKNDNLAWFSSRGKEVVIGAPGVAVTQQTICQGGKNKCEVFGVFNGTSMASPHVAGVAAMIVSEGVTDNEAVKDALTSNAVAKDKKEYFGAGILNAARSTSHVWWMHAAWRFAFLNVFAWLVFRRIRKAGGEVSRGPGVWIGALLGSVGLARALPALGLSALLFGSKRARPFVGALALGSGALVAQMAFSGDVAFVFGSFALKVFAAANIAVCAWLATIALNKKA